MQSRRRFLGAMSVPALSAVAVAVPCKNSNEMQDTVPGGLTVPGFGPPASRGVLSWDGATASGSDHQVPGTIAS